MYPRASALRCAAESGGPTSDERAGDCAQFAHALRSAGGNYAFTDVLGVDSDYARRSAAGKENSLTAEMVRARRTDSRSISACRRAGIREAVPPLGSAME